MNFIIFDLEATCWNGNPTDKEQEIIEIGACMINSFGEFVSSYNKFIKPILNPQLSSFCQELTSISQVDVNRSDTFDKVIQHFQDWIGIYEDDYLLCSWGYFDKNMLIQDCLLHDLETEWANEHINLKQQYRDIKSYRKPIGLKKAVVREGFEFTGIHHRAISDAENLSKIFIKYLDDWKY